LGVIWYQLVTGDLEMLSVPPDWREQLGRRGLPEGLVKLLASCIAPKAEARPASAVALAQQLRAGLSAVERPPERKERPFSWTPLVAGLAILLAVVLVLVVSMSSPNKGEGPMAGKKAGDIKTNSLGMKLAWIPSGTFKMGSPVGEPGRNDDEVQHDVTLTKGFYLGVYEVTQAQWRAVMGDNPSSFKGDDHPVDNVSWDDCQEFCKKLSLRDGRRYRLPTEAEWEYACRAGTTSQYYSGDGEEALRKVGWYAGNSWRQPHVVGGLAPNAWGLYDMHGNVWEWCADGAGPYPAGNVTDYKGPQSGINRILRGGCWANDARDCRAAYRGKVPPVGHTPGWGLRVCFCLD
jgi:formylglycine-generating enzyme required for sulfatase activity